MNYFTFHVIFMSGSNGLSPTHTELFFKVNFENAMCIGISCASHSMLEIYILHLFTNFCKYINYVCHLWLRSHKNWFEIALFLQLMLKRFKTHTFVFTMAP